MKILALEPYYGGSHKSFLDNWIDRSSHDWTLLGLPAYKWKWRMRHAPHTFAERLVDFTNLDCDCLVTSDMLDIATWRGLAPPQFSRLPILIYFHENQLTYPVRDKVTRDLHFGFTNLTSAFSADTVWFNSEYHRQSFLTAARELINRMPDFQPREMPAQIEDKSHVHSPGLPSVKAGDRDAPDSPIHIIWAARWEHDKNPGMFFEAIRRLKADGRPFKLSVIGEQFDDCPGCFASARDEFAGQIVHWGYQPTREAYEAVLKDADLFVSTADHEFFGIAVGEAILAGCRPLLPDRLAYPDILRSLDNGTHREVFYDGTVDGLVSHLLQLTTERQDSSDWNKIVSRCRECFRPFQWDLLAPDYDALLVELANIRDEA